jgi:hypothetical protein
MLVSCDRCEFQVADRRLAAKVCRVMKAWKRFVSLAVVATAAATTLRAGEFHSVVITTSPLTLNVNDDHSLRIWNFTQQGGTERALVTVTTSTGTANVLAATIIDPTASPTPGPLEPINQVVIAGPAQVTVTPVADATLFITYRKQLDEQGGTPSSSPTATATATATPTPTPIPTPTPTPTP